MWADPDADYEKIGKQQAELEDKIAAADAWSLDRNVEIAMDALRCPPDDADVTDALRRRAPPRRAVPPAARPPRPAAARRADQPPRRRERRLARAVPAGLPRHRRRHHPRPLLPRQRGQVDPRARPRPGLPVRGQLLVAGSSRSRRAWPARRSSNDGPPAHARSASSSGCAWRPRPARPRARPASPPTRSCTPRPRPPTAAPTGSRSRSPPGRRLGDQVIEVERPAQGLRRPAADRGPVVLAAAGRHRRHHRPERRRQDHAVPDAHRPGAARRRHDHDRRHRRARLRRPEPRQPRPRRHRLRGDHRRRRRT